VSSFGSSGAAVGRRLMRSLKMPIRPPFARVPKHYHETRARSWPWVRDCGPGAGAERRASGLYSGLSAESLLCVVSYSRIASSNAVAISSDHGSAGAGRSQSSYGAGRCGFIRRGKKCSRGGSVVRTDGRSLDARGTLSGRNNLGDGCKAVEGQALRGGIVWRGRGKLR
jgi:hypothetical protein